jgi:glucosylceramidase
MSLGYGGMDRLTDGTYGYNDVLQTHKLIPNKLLLATEGCSCPGVEIDSWLRAERLGHDVIFDLQNFANGWIDWNLLVDAEGGPNHLHNYCDASIFTSKNFSNIHLQPKFFYFAHFFRFVVPGSKRIESKVVGNYHYELLDPNIQPGVEIALFSCERSSRQIWRIDTKTNSITLQASTLLNIESGPLCIARGDSNRNYLRLASCGVYPIQEILQVTQNANGQLIDGTTGLCVSVEDSIFEGSLLTLKDCDSSKVSAVQTFKLTEHQELIIADDDKALCTTAGWPFLSGAAFVTPQNRTTFVLMNEASVPSKYVLSDGTKDDVMGLAIDASAIQTIVY